MGHEFVHVNQFINLVGQPYSLTTDGLFINFIENQAEEWENAISPKNFMRDDFVVKGIRQFSINNPSIFEILKYYKLTSSMPTEFPPF